MPETPEYRTLLAGDFGPGKTNLLFNLIIQQPDIDEKYLYATDFYEAKYLFLLINEKVQAYSILMIVKLLLNTLMIWIIFVKILENTNQIKNVKH